MNLPAQHFTKSMWFRVTCICIATLVVAGIAFVKWRASIDNLDRPDENLDAMTSGERLIAAELALNSGDRQRAVTLLKALSDDDSTDGVRGAILLGNIYVELGQAVAAEKEYRRALVTDRTSTHANRQMLFLLTMEGRRWESAPHFLNLIRERTNTLEELILLGDLWPDYDLRKEANRFLAAAPNDPLPRLGAARFLIHSHQPAEALITLRQIVTAHPALPEPHAWLGFALIKSGGSDEDICRWNKQLPTHADEHPMIWYVRSLWATRTDQNRAAIRCLWEAVRRDPNYDSALIALSRALSKDGQDAAAEVFRDRADQQYRLAALLKQVHFYRDDLARLPGGVRKLRAVAEHCEAMGRLWEAWSWYSEILEFQPNVNWARTARDRLVVRLKTTKPGKTLADFNPTRSIDLSNHPLPRWDSARTVDSPKVSRVRLPTIQFIDVAKSTGLDFRHFNGGDPQAPQTRLLETTGGGVCVLDYDADGWPDVYLTQGAERATAPGRRVDRDRLFRNMGNGTFRDMTVEAGLGDARFSQGGSVGDWDDDGMPDIFLANLGANRLYRNNGDGTFSEVSWSANLATSEWTTSCLIADVNGDGFSDLYEVNYVGGDATQRLCTTNGRSTPCTPTKFPAQDDRLWLNSGDGRFSDVTHQAGVVGRDGKGLGIIAADFEQSGRLNLFVANDGAPNFYFRNTTPQKGGPPSFQEDGLRSGLALDRVGQYQACMGAAVGDADGDGHLDVFVTNFLDEFNTLYIADATINSFDDRTVAFRLSAPSRNLLGFGTQFIDADLDGRPDLIVTNGHIRDSNSSTIPYRMPAQFFRNVEGRYFEEVSAKSLGPFFDRRLLGRGMARLDWNRDGLEDVIISHIASEAALLSNQTSPHGHFVSLRLRGVDGSRDAIGTSIQLTVEGRTIVRQLTAGDGYLASNQRLLVIGLGSSRQIKSMTVRWISGQTQTFSHVPIDTELILIEGRKELLRMPAPR
jgi:tetratricopeptide (TPR) repeat protein